MVERIMVERIMVERIMVECIMVGCIMVECIMVECTKEGRRGESGAYVTRHCDFQTDTGIFKPTQGIFKPTQKLRRRILSYLRLWVVTISRSNSKALYVYLPTI